MIHNDEIPASGLLMCHPIETFYRKLDGGRRGRFGNLLFPQVPFWGCILTKDHSFSPAALSKQSSVPPSLGITPSSCPFRARGIREPRRYYPPGTAPSLYLPYTLCFCKYLFIINSLRLSELEWAPVACQDPSWHYLPEWTLCKVSILYEKKAIFSPFIRL